MSELIKLLNDLGRDAGLAAQYRDDADSVIERYGLSAEAAKALKGEDIETIRRLSGLTEVHLTNGTIHSHD